MEPDRPGDRECHRYAVYLQSGFGEGFERSKESRRRWDRDTDRDQVEQFVLDPIRVKLAAQAHEAMARTAATKVNFFTMVRGDD